MKYAGARRSFWGKIAALVLSLGILTAGGARAEGGEAVLTWINVGRADSILVRLEGRAYLIDTGTEASAPRLLGTLATLGVTRLDGVFLTHTHSDHVGGMRALASAVEIGTLYSASISEYTKKGKNTIVELGRELSLEHIFLEAGDTVDGVFEVLGPLTYDSDDDNDNSLVLMLKVNGRTALFTGDMQFPEEETLLKAGVALKADILKVGNHGNPDATSDAFAKAVSPELAVFTTDTAEDADSANPRVVRALSGAQFLNTQDYALAVSTVVEADGTLLTREETRPIVNASVRVAELDKPNQTVTLENQGKKGVDLSGWMIHSSRGGELFVFPQGAYLEAGASCVVACEGGEGDYIWPNEKKAWNVKKDDICRLYDLYGRQQSKAE